MSKLSLIEKWAIIKDFYESSSRHPDTNDKIVFAQRPTDTQVEFLWSQMNKFKRSVHDLSFENPFLLERMDAYYEKKTGQKKPE